MNDTLPRESKPIKLVYVIGRYPELTDTFIDREIEALRRLGKYEVRTLSLRYPKTIKSFSSEQKATLAKTLYIVPSRWSNFNFTAFIQANLHFMVSRPFVYFQTILYLLTRPHPNIHVRVKTFIHILLGIYAAYRLRHEEIDHIHAHFIDRSVVVALVISRLLGKSYSLTAHAVDIYTKAILIPEKITNACFVITVSQYNKEYLLRTYPGIDPDKVHILHPWVDVSDFTHSSNRPVHPRFQILSVGRLVEKKGHSDLIDACHLLQEQGFDFETRIVGEGPLRTDLEGRIAHYTLQDRVHLMGGQSPDQVRELLSGWADVFTLPCVIASNGDRDGMPVSLAEAMAMELPVISTDIIGISELVQPDTGILIPPHNPAALAEAIRTISMQDHSTRRIMGLKGRAVVEAEFNLLKGTQELADLFCTSIAENTCEGSA